MTLSRKVAISGNEIYQDDSGISSYQFTLDKVFNQIDLSTLDAYLKINYSDDSGDKILLTKQTDGDKIKLLWNISAVHTRVSGEASCQVQFENADETVIYNSEIFTLGIKDSIKVDLCEVQAVPTYIQQLQTELSEGLDYVEGIIDGGIVSSVNGSSGAVSVTAASIGAVTTTEMQNEVAKVVAGTTVAGKSLSATNDSDGNVIKDTYLKIANQKSDDWELLVDDTQGSNTTYRHFAFYYKYKRLFIYFQVAGDTTNAEGEGYVYVHTNRIDGITQAILEPNGFTLPKAPYKKSIMLDIEMCGRFAKVKKYYHYHTDNEICDGKEYNNADTDGSFTFTLGKDINQKYIDNVKISFVSANNTNLLFAGSKVTVYGIRYNL